jgi:hypothetical protein
MKRPLAIDPVNLCTHCPHEVINLGRRLYCPCEDCHVGGLIQGREPFALTTTYVRASEGNVATTHRPSAPPTEEAPLWVDPIHSLD